MLRGVDVQANARRLVGHLRQLLVRPENGEFCDAALLDRFIASRDEAAFAALVDRHGLLVLNVCRRVVGDAHEAEDAFQSAFMVLARKADSIYPRNSLAAWLHGVAYRVALKTRASRARHFSDDPCLAAAAADWRPNPHVDAASRELLATVDEEIRRLPQAYRLPVILCCLEGKSLDEAAQQLGWSAGSVKGRLERGRSRLRDRLAQRGLTVPAAILICSAAETVSSAAEASRLAPRTIQAALAFAAGRSLDEASSSVAAVAGDIAAGLVRGELKLIPAILVAACLATAGFAALRMFASSRKAAPEDSSPLAIEDRGGWAQPVAEPSEALGPWPEFDARPIRVMGRVVDPAGRPMAGARLYVGYAPRNCNDPCKNNAAAWIVRAVSDADGKFEFTFAKSELDEQYLDVSRPAVVALADGFGMAWSEIGAASLDLRLTEDFPLQGRVLDQRRRPVEGARIVVREVGSGSAESLKRFAETHDRDLPTLRFFRGPLPGQSASATTAADGSFQLAGIGRGRLATLAIDGPALERADWSLVLEPGANREYVARPSRTIRGTVRDKSSGRPVSGVEVRLENGSFAAITDANGRYELHGCNRAANYIVIAQPKHGEPYFAVSDRFLENPGPEPLQAELALTGGIRLAGKVRDPDTGRPPRRALVMYYPLFGNAKGGSLLNRSYWTPTSSAVVDADGSYCLAVLPGPGVICVSASPRHSYASALLDPDEWTRRNVKPALDASGSALRVVFGECQARLASERFHAVSLINPPDSAKALTLDLAVQPARPVAGTIVGPDGQPISGVTVRGLTAFVETETLESHSFAVSGMNSGGTRQLLFRHREMRLGKIVSIRGDQVSALKVQLQPNGVVTGRLVDRAGKPMPGAHIYFYRDKSFTDATTQTDAEGRFRAELVSGVKYSIGSNNFNRVQLLKSGVLVEAGRTVELGDVSPIE